MEKLLFKGEVIFGEEMKILFLIIVSLHSVSLFCQQKEKIVYKYKKYQEFDLEKLGVVGEEGSPLDLSSKLRLQVNFKNRLPLRRNFNPELRRSIEAVR